MSDDRVLSMMVDKRVLSRMVDKRGREFLAGKELRGLPGVQVRGIERTGNYVTVQFGRVDSVPVPRPLLMHMDDVRTVV